MYRILFPGNTFLRFVVFLFCLQPSSILDDLIEVNAADPPVAAKIALPQKDWTQYLPNSPLAVAHLRPRSLMLDTEMDVLRDLSILGQAPIPPSVVEDLVIICSDDHVTREPVITLVGKLNQEIQSAAFVGWLAPHATLFEKQGMQIFQKNNNSGIFSVAFPQPDIVVLSTDFDLLLTLCEQRTDQTSKKDPVYQSLQSMLNESNLAAVVHLERLRYFYDMISQKVVVNSLQSALLQLPTELEMLKLQVLFGRDKNHLAMFLTTQGLTEGQVRQLPISLIEPLYTLGNKFQQQINNRLTPEFHSHAQSLFADMKQYVSRLQLSVEPTQLHWTDPHPHSLSRTSSLVAKLLTIPVLLMRSAARESIQRNNMKQVLLSWKNTEESTNIPIQDITDKKANSLLSWRVSLLPNLGYEALFKKFRLNESWDSPHNRALISQMPPVYAFPSEPNVKQETYLQALNGPGTILGDKVFTHNLQDGMSNTVLLTYARKPVIWTKPDDFVVPETNIMAELKLDTEGCCMLLQADGAVVRYSKLTDPTLLKLAHHADGKVIEYEELNPQGATSPVKTATSLETVLANMQQQTIVGRQKPKPLTRDGYRDLLAKIYAHSDELLSDEHKDLTTNCLARLIRDHDSLVSYWACEVYFLLILSKADEVTENPVLEQLTNSDPMLSGVITTIICERFQLPGILKVLSTPGTEANIPVAMKVFQSKSTTESFLDSFSDEPAWAKLLAHPDPEFRRMVMRILSVCGTSGLIPHLEKLISDPTVGAQAKAAIEQIHKRADIVQRHKLSLENKTYELISRLQAQSSEQLERKDDINAMRTLQELIAASEQAFSLNDDIVIKQYRTLGLLSFSLGKDDIYLHCLKTISDRTAQKLGINDYRSKEALDLYKLEEFYQKLQPDQKPKFTEALGEFEKGRKAESQSNYDVAIQDYEKARELYAELSGPEYMLFIRPARSQRAALTTKKDYKAALELAISVYENALKILGPHHPTVIMDELEVAYLYHLINENEKAVEWFERALPRVPHEEAIPAHSVLATIHYRLKNPDGEKTELSRMLDKACLVYDVAKLTDGFSRLATSQLETGEVNRAEKNLLSAIYFSNLTSQPLNFRFLYGQYATMQQQLGNYPLELALREKHLEEMERAISLKLVNNEEYSKAYLNLAKVWFNLGDPLQAEKFLQTSINISSRYLKEPMWQQALLQARLLDFNGNLPAAKIQFEIALTKAMSDERILPQEMEDLLRQQAMFLEKMQDDDSSLETWIKLVNAGTFADVYLAQQNKVSLALNLIRKKRDTDARMRLNEVEETLKTLTGHPEQSAIIQMKLAEAWSLLKSIPESQAHIATAVESARRYYGDNSMILPEMLAEAALISLRNNKSTEAQNLAREALSLSHDLFVRSAYFLSPRQQLSLGKKLRLSLDIYLEIALQNHPEGENLYAEIYRWKGNNQVRLKNLRRVLDQKSMGSFFTELNKTVTKISSIHPPAIVNAQMPENTALMNQQADQLNSLRESLERQMNMAQLSQLDELLPISYSDFEKSIPADGVFLDYFVLTTHSAQTDKKFLLLTLIRPDKPSRTINLGPLDPLVEAINTWRAGFGYSPTAITAGKFLREKLWDPVQAELKSAQIILISPDSALGQLPFQALPGVDPDTYLLQQYPMVMIPVPQLLSSTLEEMKSIPHSSANCLLIGDIDYGAVTPVASNVVPETTVTDTSQVESPKKSGPTGGLMGGSGLKSGIGETPKKKNVPKEPPQVKTPPPPPMFNLIGMRGGGSFSALPGTTEEIAEIKKIASQSGFIPEDKVLVYSKLQATEAQFRMTVPRVPYLHIATHGYFADLRTDSKSSGVGHDFAELNPGTLSGLAFAGVNTPHIPGADDGIMTADEISTLDLSQTRLAVLSACETGLGLIADGEGMIGIQRAFQVSGARTTITSLWKVDDRATQILMTKFYENMWSHKMGRLEALRQAQIWMLNHPHDIWTVAPITSQSSEEDRSDRRLTKPKSEVDPQAKTLSPQFWAAFVISGDWR
jgi:CHAT domain-containing protein